MYPPTGKQYARIPNSDPDSSDDVEAVHLSNSSVQRNFHPRTRRLLLIRVAVGFAVACFLFALVSLFKNRLRTIPAPNSPNPPINGLFPNNTVLFGREPRPVWLDPIPDRKPYVFRVAIVSRVDEFDRRDALRQGVFRGIPEADVHLEYRFFVGATADTGAGRKTKHLVEQEMESFGDVIMLHDVPDVIERLAEKRYGALKWGGSVPNDTYDYFITLDSDTFCRFSALARHLPLFLEEKNITLNPREHPILIGRMSAHLLYFLNTVEDGNPKIIEDTKLKGPWYHYPSGIGYMLSSSLVKTMLSTDPPLPHHVLYPGDDVMIGAWVASLQYFPENTVHEFRTDVPDNEPSERVYPKPFLPYVVTTAVLDDVAGWHDFPHEGQTRWRDELEAPISWGSVCIHHLFTEQIKAFRKMEAIRGEWDD